MTSGELMIGTEDSKFAVLRPDSDIREALAANLAAGEVIEASDLPRVSVPAGGGLVWSWTDSGNNDQSAKAIDGVLVWFGPQGTLWGSEQPQSGVPPVLVTHDLQTAYRVNDDIGDLDAEALESCRIGDREYDWQRLPYNKPGSAGNGTQMRRCKESRLLAILREDDAWPLLVRCGVGSLKNVRRFLKTGMTVPHYRTVVSLTLQKATSEGGQPYSQVVPRAIGTLSQEEGLIVQKLYTQPLSRMSQQLGSNSDD
jgi:hypothetical protein